MQANKLQPNPKSKLQGFQVKFRAVLLMKWMLRFMGCMESLEDLVAFPYHVDQKSVSWVGKVIVCLV